MMSKVFFCAWITGSFFLSWQSYCGSNYLCTLQTFIKSTMPAHLTFLTFWLWYEPSHSMCSSWSCSVHWAWLLLTLSFRSLTMFLSICSGCLYWNMLYFGGHLPPILWIDLAWLLLPLPFVCSVCCACFLLWPSSTWSLSLCIQWCLVIIYVSVPASVLLLVFPSCLIIWLPSAIVVVIWTVFVCLLTQSWMSSC